MIRGLKSPKRIPGARFQVGDRVQWHDGKTLTGQIFHAGPMPNQAGLWYQVLCDDPRMVVDFHLEPEIAEMWGETLEPAPAEVLELIG